MIRKRKKEGAIELSMSTIIIIIIGITLLSLGLVWVKGYFGKIEELTSKSFETAEKEIEEKMGGDEKFYVSRSTINLKVGKSTTLYTGIQNFEGATHRFGVRARSETEGVNMDEWFKLPPTISIAPGEKKGFPILITAPKTSRPGEAVYFVVEAYKEAGKEPYAEEILIVNIP